MSNGIINTFIDNAGKEDEPIFVEDEQHVLPTPAFPLDVQIDETKEDEGPTISEWNPSLGERLSLAASKEPGLRNIQEILNFPGWAGYMAKKYLNPLSPDFVGSSVLNRLQGQLEDPDIMFGRAAQKLKGESPGYTPLLPQVDISSLDKEERNLFYAIEAGTLFSPAWMKNAKYLKFLEKIPGFKKLMKSKDGDKKWIEEVRGQLAEHKKLLAKSKDRDPYMSIDSGEISPFASSTNPNPQKLQDFADRVRGAADEARDKMLTWIDDPITQEKLRISLQKTHPELKGEALEEVLKDIRERVFFAERKVEKIPYGSPGSPTDKHHKAITDRLGAAFANINFYDAKAYPELFKMIGSKIEITQLANKLTHKELVSLNLHEYRHIFDPLLEIDAKLIDAAMSSTYKTNEIKKLRNLHLNILDETLKGSPIPNINIREKGGGERLIAQIKLREKMTYMHQYLDIKTYGNQLYNSNYTEIGSRIQELREFEGFATPTAMRKFLKENPNWEISDKAKKTKAYKRLADVLPENTLKGLMRDLLATVPFFPELEADKSQDPEGKIMDSWNAEETSIGGT